LAALASELSNILVWFDLVWFGVQDDAAVVVVVVVVVKAVSWRSSSEMCLNRVCLVAGWLAG